MFTARARQPGGSVRANSSWTSSPAFQLLVGTRSAWSAFSRSPRPSASSTWTKTCQSSVVGLMARNTRTTRVASPGETDGGANVAPTSSARSPSTAPFFTGTGAVCVRAAGGPDLLEVGASTMQAGRTPSRETRASA